MNKQILTLTLLILIMMIYLNIYSGNVKSSGSLTVTVIIPHIDMETAASPPPSSPPINTSLPSIEVADFHIIDNYLNTEIINHDSINHIFNILITARDIKTGEIHDKTGIDNINIRPYNVLRFKFPEFTGENLYIMSIIKDSNILQSACIRHRNFPDSLYNDAFVKLDKAE